MNNAILPAVILMSISFSFSMMDFNSTCAADEEAKAKAQWVGRHQESDLKGKAPAAGAVVDSKSWKQLWTTWKGDEALPKIDFEKDLVVVATINGPNRMFIGKMLIDRNGDLSYLAGGTKIGGPGFGFILVQVDRNGIKSVNGKPLPKPAGQKQGAKKEIGVYVAVIGKIKTGMMAIGGETTGTVITAGNITWELSIQRQSETMKLIRENRDAVFEVNGQLRRKAGVEIRERWIVDVKSLKVVK
jgi:hypothetical protein